jgi:hypothetical protein
VTKPLPYMDGSEILDRLIQETLAAPIRRTQILTTRKTAVEGPRKPVGGFRVGAGRPRALNASQALEAHRRWLAGVTHVEQAKVFGCRPSTVWQAILGVDPEARSRKRVGRRTGAAKLTVEQRQQIYDAWKAGESMTAIGPRFDVGLTTVRRVVQRLHAAQAGHRKEVARPGRAWWQPQTRVR